MWMSSTNITARSWIKMGTGTDFLPAPRRFVDIHHPIQQNERNWRKRGPSAARTRNQRNALPGLAAVYF
jgi:hypothetical protein